YRQQEGTINELQHLAYQFVRAAQTAQQERVQEHLRHGMARRANVLARCIANIYKVFPPNLERPLDREALSDVQISLHAYVINLCGLFDNCAWAFVLQHGLETQFQPKQIGLFKPRLQALLAQPLRDYLETEHFKRWRAAYLTNYRDSLAHRIPLYIPPAIWTPADNQRYNALDAETSARIRHRHWDRVDALRAEQDRLGTPCFGFLHSFSTNERPALIRLHTQLISDG